MRISPPAIRSLNMPPVLPAAGATSVLLPSPNMWPQLPSLRLVQLRSVPPSPSLWSLPPTLLDHLPLLQSSLPPNWLPSFSSKRSKSRKSRVRVMMLQATLPSPSRRESRKRRVRVIMLQATLPSPRRGGWRRLATAPLLRRVQQRGVATMRRRMRSLKLPIPRMVSCYFV